VPILSCLIYVVTRQPIVFDTDFKKAMALAEDGKNALYFFLPGKLSRNLGVKGQHLIDC
jgi:hypothetical protein